MQRYETYLTKDKKRGKRQAIKFADILTLNVFTPQDKMSMAGNNAVKSKRDQHLERMRKKYPEKKFEDDEEIYGQISDDYDQYEQELDGYRGREKKLSDMFAADPRSAQLLTDMHNGQDPVIGLVRNFGQEIRDVLDDPEMQDKIAEAQKDFMERTAKSKKLDEEYESNMDATLESLRQYQQSQGLSDEDIDNICAAWLQIVRDGVMGKLTSETITLIANALNHDADVANAQQEGEVAGRNSKIVETHRKRTQGDGTQPMNGKNGQPGGASRRSQSMFDLAQEAM